MEITCPRCGSRYHIDPPATSRTRSSRGLKFRCSHCSHTFGVDPAQPHAPAAAKAAARALEPPSRSTDHLPLLPMGEAIRLIQQQAQIYEVSDMGTLYRWILEHRVVRTDLFSVHGMRWQAIGDRPDLERFFAAADALKGAQETAIAAAAAAPAAAAAARWDPMDVVPMEETPSSVDFSLYNSGQRRASEPPSPSATSNTSGDANTSAGILLTDRISNAPPPQQPLWSRRSPLEEMALEVQSSEDGRREVLPDNRRRQVPEDDDVTVEAPSSAGVMGDNVLSMDHQDPPSAFAMEESGTTSGDVITGDFGDHRAAVHVGDANRPSDSIPSEETSESQFWNPSNSGLAEVVSDEVQPVLRTRPPVIRKRPAKNRADDGMNDDFFAPEQDRSVSETRPTSPMSAADPGLGPPPRVSITPPQAAPRPPIDEDEPVRTGTPPWVWGIAGSAVVIIGVIAFLGWQSFTKEPETTAVNPVKVQPETAPTEVVSPPAEPPPTVSPTPAGSVVAPVKTTPAPTPAPDKPKPVVAPAVTPPPAVAAVPAAPPKLSVKQLVKRGWDDLGKKNYQSAYDSFNTAVQSQPSNADALYGRGYAALKMGNTASARQDLCSAKRQSSDPELAIEIDGILRQAGGGCN